MKGRAKTYEEKRAIMERILAVWAGSGKRLGFRPSLGQLLDNALCFEGHSGDLFTTEDERLAELVEGFGS